MGRTACTEPHYLYKGALYLTFTGKGKGHPNTCLLRHKEEAEVSSKQVVQIFRVESGSVSSPGAGMDV